AQVIHASHRGSLDAALNLTYATPGYCRGFVETLVLRAGCGRFDPDASFLAEGPTGPVGVILSSHLSRTNGHVCQVSVAPEAQGGGLGELLMTSALSAFRKQGLSTASLSVTYDNRRAYRLYERLGFQLRKEFAAHAWVRPPARIELPACRARSPSPPDAPNDPDDPPDGRGGVRRRSRPRRSSLGRGSVSVAGTGAGRVAVGAADVDRAAAGAGEGGRETDVHGTRRSPVHPALQRSAGDMDQRGRRGRAAARAGAARRARGRAGGSAPGPGGAGDPGRPAQPRHVGAGGGGAGGGPPGDRHLGLGRGQGHAVP